MIRDYPFGYTTSERPRRILGYGELELVAQSRRLSSLILSFLFAPSSQVNFINPGILDAYSTFTKIYEKPIARSVPLVSPPSFELTFPRLFSSSHRSDLEILTARRESSNSVKLEVRNSQRSELSSSFDVPPTSSASSCLRNVSLRVSSPLERGADQSSLSFSFDQTITSSSSLLPPCNWISSSSSFILRR